MAEEAEFVVDAEVVDDYPSPEPAPVSTALVRRERRSEVIRPLNVDQLVESFHEYQSMLPRLLDDSDYQEFTEQGKTRRFVKKSGWRKIGTAFDLDVLIISDHIERDPDGRALRAKVIARAVAPSGRSMDGDGYCDVDEKRFAHPASRGKLENDLRATASTRAKNRAIADLVGMGDVSAEELHEPHEPQAQTARSPFGPPADKNQTARASRALTKLLGGDEARAKHDWATMRGVFDGIMPTAAAYAIEYLAKVVVVGGTDPIFIDPTGDIPVDEKGSQVQELQDRALALWTELEGEKKALARVNGAPEQVPALRALVRAALEAKAVAA